MSEREVAWMPAAGTGAPALSVDHLSKRFGDRVAFEDLSFEVGRGEVFGFLGPNGAGKTTTVLFTPLLALLSIWVGMAISTRSSDTRVAQQLSLLGSLPLVAVTSLIAFDVIHATLGLAVVLAVLLIVLDLLGWRIVAAMFDRERLLVGAG